MPRSSGSAFRASASASRPFRNSDSGTLLKTPPTTPAARDTALMNKSRLASPPRSALSSREFFSKEANDRTATAPKIAGKLRGCSRTNRAGSPAVTTPTTPKLSRTCSGTGAGSLRMREKSDSRSRRLRQPEKIKTSTAAKPILATRLTLPCWSIGFRGQLPVTKIFLCDLRFVLSSAANE